MYFFLMIRRSPISTLFPYTTLFRSGPSILGLVLPSNDLHVLSNLAVFFLMFLAGLEMDPREIRRAGGSAIVISIIAFFVPLLSGTGTSLLFGLTTVESLFKIGRASCRER